MDLVAATETCDFSLADAAGSRGAVGFDLPGFSGCCDSAGGVAAELGRDDLDVESGVEFARDLSEWVAASGRPTNLDGKTLSSLGVSIYSQPSVPSADQNIAAYHKSYIFVTGNYKYTCSVLYSYDLQ